MYKPNGCKTLAEVKEAQIRLGIQGYSGVGKSWSALTFPNPVVLNLDRGLGAHIGRSDVIDVPLYDPAYCRTINPAFARSSQLKDTILMWFDKEAKKLEPDQTLIVDGGTGLQNAFHKWMDENPVYSQQGKVDDYAPWKLKLVFFGDICERIKTLKCHVVYISHESEKKDKSGEYTGKIRPLLTGQFQDQLGSHFTDWVRQFSVDKPKLDKIDDKMLVEWKMTKEEFVLMLDTYPRNTIYYWLLESDNAFDGKVSSLVNFPRFIPANYQSFSKYRRTNG